MRHRPNIATVLVCLVIFSAASFVRGQSPGGDAELVEKENQVDAQKPAKAWQKAEVGLALATRDKVRTGEFSRAVVRFQDRSMMRMDELTTFEITSGAKPAMNLK